MRPSSAPRQPTTTASISNLAVEVGATEVASTAGWGRPPRPIPRGAPSGRCSAVMAKHLPSDGSSSMRGGWLPVKFRLC